MGESVVCSWPDSAKLGRAFAGAARAVGSSLGCICAALIQFRGPRCRRALKKWNNEDCTEREQGLDGWQKLIEVSVRSSPSYTVDVSCSRWPVSPRTIRDFCADRTGGPSMRISWAKTRWSGGDFVRAVRPVANVHVWALICNRLQKPLGRSP